MNVQPNFWELDIRLREDKNCNPKPCGSIFVRSISSNKEKAVATGVGGDHIFSEIRCDFGEIALNE